MTHTLANSKTGVLHVCPFSAVPALVERAKASHLITLLQGEIVVDRPRTILPDKHLRVRVHDISEPLDGCIVPDQSHIDEIISFARQWGGQGSMVVHCWAGISRSTAAAYVSLCAINPDASEKQVAARLREASPTACPNRLMIRLADAALGRGGRMVRAIEDIGRGVVATEAVPFSLAADLSKAG